MTVTVKVKVNNNTQWDLSIEEAEYLYRQLSKMFKDSPLVYEETLDKVPNISKHTRLFPRLELGICQL